MLNKISSNVLVIITGVFFIFLSTVSLMGTEEIAKITGKSCRACHLDPSGGGELTKEGDLYLEQMLEENEGRIEGSRSIPGKSIRDILRLIAGYIHILTAIFWFGTILYVHIVLKPSYAVRGLPRGEVRVGLVSMVVMGITGVVLTLFRMSSFSMVLETRFGILFMVKVFLYLVMVSTALVAVFRIGPKLKKAERRAAPLPGGDMTVDDLQHFDGTGDNRTLIAYRNRIYDVTESTLWAEGRHAGRHQAGADMTSYLKQAPHGEDVLNTMPQLGHLTEKPTGKSQPPHIKYFFIIANLNLAIVFLITLILALWRWW